MRQRKHYVFQRGGKKKKKKTAVVPENYETCTVYKMCGKNAVFYVNVKVGDFYRNNRYA